MTKKKFRSCIKASLSELAENTLQSAGIRIGGFITSMPDWNTFDAVLSFSATEEELPMTPLHEATWKEEKILALPRITGPGKMVFHRTTPSCELKTNRWGIPEPLSSSPLFDFETFSAGKKRILMIVPGLGFALDGARLGRGGGFYDRFLKQYESNLTTLGVAMDCQIFNLLPTDQWDMKVQRLCSASGWIKKT